MKGRIMSEFKNFYSISPWAALVYQLTSARTVQAIVVLILTSSMVGLLIASREVPEIVSSALYVILGYYFGDRQNNGPENGDDKRVVKD